MAGRPDGEGGTSDLEIKPLSLFPACRGVALSDISIALEDENLAETELVTGRSASGRALRRAAVAVDIGTTTVSAILADGETGEALETVSALNDQRVFGADVMSRINAARQGKTGELFSAINRQVESMLRAFIQKWAPPVIEQCVVSGNTTMLHLFTNTDPSGMGELPFTPVFLGKRRFAGRELSLSSETITLLPGVSAFVGADIVSGLAMLDILNRDDNSLLVDIGTNGEMALFRKGGGGRLLCCSTAAGPCFEGAEISCGMGALPGAINRISLKNNTPEGLVFSTLGNLPPRGICGAGLIDAFAAMKRLGAIDETGALADAYAQEGFPIAGGVSILNRDVRQFQLAKSAILSGITLLCRKAGLSAGELSAVYIAGGFGFFIDKENAVRAGLLPPEFAAGKTAVCGNLSLKGALQSLTDRFFLARCEEIAAVSETIDLASDPEFMEVFAENMYF
jgi:uncharacterized 2Fe-2S/4Fe-4S cluster protein (DUF4445 family)